MAKAHIDYLGSWLQRIHKVSNKGVHADLDRLEAIKAVLHTYLMVGDILSYLNMDSNLPPSMSLVIERSPSSFVTLDEEAIRTHFLLQLNGHYEGGASGETFNASGKTDILIRVNNKNIFIAECKFWRGQKVFNDTIAQLLGYLSWRDTKCAILIFNKTKDTTGVRSKMHQTMESRSEHRRTVSYNEDGDSRYIFVKKDEPGREIIITTQIYDIPTNSD